MTATLSAFRADFSMDIVEVDVDFPDGKKRQVFFKPMSSQDRDEFEAGFVSKDAKSRKAGTINLKNTRGRFLALCWVEQDGSPVGTAEEIGALHSGITAPIYNEFQKLAGFDEKDVEEAGKD